MSVDAPGRSSTKGSGGDDALLKKDFGTVGLLFTAIGSIIGSGWLFGALKASQIAGPAAIFSWLIGTVMFVLIGLTYAEVGVMFPRSGGLARYPHYAFGSFTSFTMGWITWLATVAVAPVEVQAVTQYANNYLPWLQVEANGTPVLTNRGLVVAVALMAIFTVVNFFGVRWFARINNVLVWWKLAIIALVVVVFFAISFDSTHFVSFGGFAPFGTTGVFEAIPTASIAFAFFGFRQGIELAGETSNPSRNIPLTVVGSVVLCGLIYIALQIAFIGAVPSSSISAGGWASLGHHIIPGTSATASGSFGPLAATASVLGVGWLAVLLYADAIISPSDTGLIYTGVTARLSYGMGRNRNAPAALAKVNKTGVPWLSLLLAFVIGCLFFLPFPGWQQLVEFITNTTVLSFGMGPLVLIVMRKQLPHTPRPFRLKGAWVIAFLALWSSNLIVYWTGWDTNWKMFVAILLGLVLLTVQQTTAKTITPALELRHGWWLLVWFSGLAVISYLGSYPAVSKGAGNVGVLTFGVGAGLCFVLTAVVMALACACRLPSEQVRQRVLLSDDDGHAPVAG
ncbi:MAG: APC family permease [Pseudonocardiaceae bacterium]